MSVFGLAILIWVSLTTVLHSVSWGMLILLPLAVSLVKVSVADSFYVAGALTLLFSHPGLGPAKAELFL